MAITSIGYAGTVNAFEWAKLAPRIGELYSVDFNGFNAVVAAGDRAIRITPGVATGAGICDTSDANVTVTHAAASSGVRYDMIVLRRTWASKLTTVAVVQGTGTREVPARTMNPGTVDEQPLFLVRITAGSTVPIIEADLRLFRGAGGLTANDQLALYYVTTVGTRISIGDVDWVLTDQAGVGPTWRRSANDILTPVQVLGISTAMVGSKPNPAETRLFLQGGTDSPTTDPNGWLRITFPKPFPNGLISFVCMNGDGVVGNIMFEIAGSPYNAYGPSQRREDVVMRVWSANQGLAVRNSRVRCNWIAIGW